MLLFLILPICKLPIFAVFHYITYSVGIYLSLYIMKLFVYASTKIRMP